MKTLLIGCLLTLTSISSYAKDCDVVVKGIELSEEAEALLLRNNVNINPSARDIIDAKEYVVIQTSNRNNLNQDYCAHGIKGTIKTSSVVREFKKNNQDKFYLASITNFTKSKFIPPFICTTRPNDIREKHIEKVQLKAAKKALQACRKTNLNE